MESINTRLAGWLQQSGMSEDLVTLLQRIGAILIILIIGFFIDLICRKAIIPVIRKITDRIESKWDDYLLSDVVMKDICRLITTIAVYALIPFALLNIAWQSLVLKVCQIYIIILSMKLICTVISSIYSMTTEHEKLKDHTLKGFFQMIKLLVICIGTIIIISTLIGKNPIAILTGLGAGTALVMLVFQDTIKGFVAGIQLMANDMLRPGDWITMPKYGADGDVMEVTLTTVKVRNWDKTIITVPPYALDFGGRRIKRSINIDMNTVRFCTKEEMLRFRKEPWMEGFEETGTEEVNLYIFRHYIEHYLRNHPKVNSEMIMTVRQLQPTAQGMPVELYFFSADTAWLKYEHLQAEVFDHVLAMLHIFGLKVFQSPTGMDIQKQN